MFRVDRPVELVSGAELSAGYCRADNTNKRQRRGYVIPLAYTHWTTKWTGLALMAGWWERNSSLNEAEGAKRVEEAFSQIDGVKGLLRL